LKQRTIAEKISCTGIGLHSGEPVQLTLEPARENTGIVFVSSDRGHAVEIPARPESVTSTRLATTIGCGDATVGTVEHLLAALYALGVDNARVVVDGPEVPVMDGSSASFVFLIRSAGIFEQRADRTRLRVRRHFSVKDGDRSIELRPARELRVDYAVDYGHPLIGSQSIRQFTVTAESFEKDICRARTFGFLHEVEALWKLGLARGGNLDNTVVLDKERVLNRDGLRWRDEFVRHKILDLVGDLALLGIPLEAEVSVSRGGHALHQMLLQQLLETPDAWELVGSSRAVSERTLDRLVSDSSLRAPA
jgi:UDP-3-O-[3-hydroxymyristoyl] N-acetylglucosamine deacetylase